MIEEAFALYFLGSVWRALRGRRTVGLLFRPKPALEAKTLRLRIKRAALKLLKLSSLVRTISILPLDVFPEFRKIVTDGIYDLQLWDLSAGDLELVSRADENDAGMPTLQAIKAAALGRTVISALGKQDKNKGFNEFSGAFRTAPNLKQKLLPVWGGQTNGDVSDSARDLQSEGAVAINRHVSNREILEIYAASSLIWAFYEKTYDQASGIMGRAIQLGIPPVVRVDSLSHRLCKADDLYHFAISCAEDLADISLPVSTKRLDGRNAAARMRDSSTKTLNNALGRGK